MQNLSPIFIVEDDPADQYVLRKRLERHIENPLKLFANTRDVVEQLKISTDDLAIVPCPALLILDLQVPGINGFGMLDWCRNHQNPRLKKLPIFILSSLQEEEARLHSKILGATAFLNKPFDLDTFLIKAKDISNIKLRITERSDHNVV